MWGNNRGNFKVMNWVQKFTIVGRICTNMHANAVKQQFAVLSWECGPLMSPTVQNVIFSNRQQFDRCYTWRWHALLIRIGLEIISCCESAFKQTENTSGSQTDWRLESNIILDMTLSIVPWEKQNHVLSFHHSTENLSWSREDGNVQAQFKYCGLNWIFFKNYVL